MLTGQKIKKGEKDPAPVEGKNGGRGLKASPAAGGPPPVIYYDQMFGNCHPTEYDLFIRARKRSLTGKHVPQSTDLRRNVGMSYCSSSSIMKLL